MNFGETFAVMVPTILVEKQPIIQLLSFTENRRYQQWLDSLEEGEKWPAAVNWSSGIISGVRNYE